MNEYHLLLFLAVGYLVFAIDKKQTYFPVPVVLVIIGILLSIIPFFHDVMITKEMLFTFFLPALLFISAYQFSSKAWQRSKYIIITLGTIGLFLTVGLLGIFIYTVANWFVPLSLLAALLIAAVLAPTDPVSVVAILKQASRDEEISEIVEGESMLNDGTSIVVLGVLLQMYTQNTGFNFIEFVNEFLLVSFGGAAIGILFGWIMSKAIYYTDHWQYQVMLSIIVAYGSFYLGELIGVSGVLSTITSGMMLSYEFGKTIEEKDFRRQLDGFWGIVEPTILSIIFLLIGIQAATYLTFSEWLFAIAIFIGTLLVRFIVIIIITQLQPTWKKTISVKDCGIITWAGIKGTMSIALVLGLKATFGNDEMLLIALIFVTILLSLVVQSAGVYPMMKKLQQKEKRV
ncbi:cation:proton antiporter [Virgibacillus proomii]|uniref:cation:proton antiporter n=1 Tax=Virgibacillus proomii TaxID=84407 RepID=UPI001C10B0F8|nr:sodium:proton antiporter [Virgibacillus proomii]MBU5266457.1 sodium:proton antiporter [Virgibacillus proomii]